MEAYKVKQKVVDRTLTIELPEEFENAEVNITIEKKVDDQAQSKEEKIAIIQRFAGICKPGNYVLPEDEWYKQ